VVVDSPPPTTTPADLPDASQESFSDMHADGRGLSRAWTGILALAAGILLSGLVLWRARRK
jgi:hypothetical protein